MPLFPAAEDGLPIEAIVKYTTLTEEQIRAL